MMKNRTLNATPNGCAAGIISFFYIYYSEFS